MADNANFHLVRDTIEWVVAHRDRQPSLSAIAAAVGVSPHHLQRTFQAWAGVSPKQFLKALTRDAALARLRDGESVLDAALGAGLSGPGRLHDLLLTTEALTPGEARRLGAGVTIRFGRGACPFGRALIAWTGRGINFLGFCNEIEPGAAEATLRDRWPRARFHQDSAGAREWLECVFGDTGHTPLPVWLHGTPFQLKVWEALLAIPENANVSYGQIAKAIGNPGASRAVGNAVGENPVAWVIPCHRVIRQLGDVGGYRWGTTTKRVLLGYEGANRDVIRSRPGP